MKSMTSTFSFLPWRRAAIGLTLMGMLAGCAGPSVQEYTQERPELDLRQYFNGPLTAHGLFTDRSGKVVKRFTVRMTGKWNGDEGVLDEHFVYSDGSTQQRIWHLKYLGVAAIAETQTTWWDRLRARRLATPSVGTMCWLCQ